MRVLARVVLGTFRAKEATVEGTLAGRCYVLSYEEFADICGLTHTEDRAIAGVRGRS